MSEHDETPHLRGRFGLFLIVAPVVTFGLLWALDYGMTLTNSLTIPLLAGLFIWYIIAMLVARGGNGFKARFIVAIPTAIAAIAGFWGPWLVRQFGPEGAQSFVLDNPESLFDRIQLIAPRYGFVWEQGAAEFDVTPYMFEMWMGVTAAFVLAAFAGAFMGGFFRRQNFTGPASQ